MVLCEVNTCEPRHIASARTIHTDRIFLTKATTATIVAGMNQKKRTHDTFDWQSSFAFSMCAYTFLGPVAMCGETCEG